MGMASCTTGVQPWWLSGRSASPVSWLLWQLSFNGRRLWMLTFLVCFAKHTNTHYICKEKQLEKMLNGIWTPCMISSFANSQSPASMHRHAINQPLLQPCSCELTARMKTHFKLLMVSIVIGSLCFGGSAYHAWTDIIVKKPFLQAAMTVDFLIALYPGTIQIGGQSRNSFHYQHMWSWYQS